MPETSVNSLLKNQNGDNIFRYFSSRFSLPGCLSIKTTYCSTSRVKSAGCGMECLCAFPAKHTHHWIFACGRRLDFLMRFLQHMGDLRQTTVGQGCGDPNAVSCGVALPPHTLSAYIYASVWFRHPWLVSRVVCEISIKISQ